MYVRNAVMDAKRFPKICKPLVADRFYCMALFLSQSQRQFMIILTLTVYA